MLKEKVLIGSKEDLEENCGFVTELPNFDDLLNGSTEIVFRGDAEKDIFNIQIRTNSNNLKTSKKPSLIKLSRRKFMEFYKLIKTTTL